MNSIFCRFFKKQKLIKIISKNIIFEPTHTKMINLEKRYDTITKKISNMEKTKKEKFQQKSQKKIILICKESTRGHPRYTDFKKKNQ